MKKADKMVKFADSGQQNLPGPADPMGGDASSAQQKSKGDNGTSYTTDFVFGGSMTESPVSRNGRKKTDRFPAKFTA
jgi:hypothetical protein